MTKPPLSGIIMDKALYGDTANTETSDMIQWFNPQKMLPEKEVSILFEAEE
jgi:hypothetical protein